MYRKLQYNMGQDFLDIQYHKTTLLAALTDGHDGVVAVRRAEVSLASADL